MSLTIVRDGKNIVLTPEELEQAYRIKQSEYLTEDVSHYAAEIGHSFSKEDISAIVTMCIEDWDASISHWDNIANAISRHIMQC